MFLPHDQWSSERLLAYYGTYLKVRLEANPETAGLGVSFQGAQSALRKSNEAERDAYLVLQAAHAMRDEAEFGLDEAIRAFGVMALSETGSLRDGATYREYFPDGVEEVLKSRLDRRLDAVALIETRVAKAPAVFGPRAAAVKLVAARDRLTKAIHTWAVARLAHSDAFTSEGLERKQWLKAYDKVFGGLHTIFPGNRRKVESFFRRGPRGRGREESPPTDTTAAAS